jgi:hypothetical protein
MTMSNLILNIQDNLGFTPEVVGYLASIKEFEYFYREYHLRHPGGIFNLGIYYVVRDMLELIEELNEHQNNYDDDRKILLAKKFRDLINDFFKFRDSLDEVVLACCKKDAPPSENEFIYRWLDKSGYRAGKDIFKQTEQDIAYFRKIYNKLKHTSNSIKTVNFHGSPSAIMGFYLEGVADDGSLGPDETIHPKYNGMHSASSYNYTLKNLYYLLYKISDSFKYIIIKHFKDVYGVELKPRADYKSNDKLEMELFEKMRNLPNAYFPNEFGQVTYEFKLESGKFGRDSTIGCYK